MQEFENTKEKIITEAMILFARKGFDGVSVREICKNAGINISMISYHFGGKKELYQAIIDTLIVRQTEFAESFINFGMDLSKMSKLELIDFLHVITDKFIDFMYSSISKELLSLLIFEQQKQNATVNPPAVIFVKKVLAQIFDKNENDKDIIFKCLFLIGNIISPRILLHFSLKILHQNDFTAEDIEIIKKNAHLYIEIITAGVHSD